MVKNFHLSERITNNILKAEKSNFISENKLTHEYSREGKSFHPFVSHCVNKCDFQNGCRKFLVRKFVLWISKRGIYLSSRKL